MFHYEIKEKLETKQKKKFQTFFTLSSIFLENGWLDEKINTTKKTYCIDHKDA